MAAQNVANFPNVPNYKVGVTSLSLNTEKEKFTTLKATLTRNYFHDLGVPFREKMGLYGRFIKEPVGVEAAMGEGIKNIYVIGGYETEVFEPPKPKDKICLVVPYHRTEISETYKNIVRLRTMTRNPDILAGSEVLISPAELISYHKMKKGDCLNGNAEILYMIITAVLQTNQLKYQYNSGGVTSILGSTDDDNTEEGKKLKLIKEAAKPLIDEENKVTNIWKWSVFEWVNDLVKEDNKKVRYKNPANAPDKAKATKLLKTNKDVTPAQTADAVIRMISRLSDLMEKPTVKNLSYWKGNDKNEFVFTKEKPALYVSCPKEKQIIMMGWELYDFLNAWAKTNLAFTSDKGSYTSILGQRLGADIIPVESIPPNVVKITTVDRYNFHSVYAEEFQDVLGQQMFVGQSVHTSWMSGIRQFVPYAELHIFDGNFDPIVTDPYLGRDPVDLN